MISGPEIICQSVGSHLGGDIVGGWEALEAADDMGGPAGVVSRLDALGRVGGSVRRSLIESLEGRELDGRDSGVVEVCAV